MGWTRVSTLKWTPTCGMHYVFLACCTEERAFRPLFSFLLQRNKAKHCHQISSPRDSHQFAASKHCFVFFLFFACSLPIVVLIAHSSTHEHRLAMPPKQTPKPKVAKGKKAHSVIRLNYSKKPAVVQAQVSKKTKIATVKAELAAKENKVSTSVIAKAAPSSNWKQLQAVRTLDTSE